jgi:hypothetical protein
MSISRMRTPRTAKSSTTPIARRLDRRRPGTARRKERGDRGCAKRYQHDRTIGDLEKACGKYEEQPIVKQQAVAECQLAAFNYAEALRALKAEFGK